MVNCPSFIKHKGTIIKSLLSKYIKRGQFPGRGKKTDTLSLCCHFKLYQNNPSIFFPGIFQIHDRSLGVFRLLCKIANEEGTGLFSGFVIELLLKTLH